MKNENPTLPASPSALKSFFLASRPKTWGASLCPVAIGAKMAGVQLAWDILILTGLFSLFIQIGTNFANDYFDFLKGADTEERIGPKRAVAQGWIAPKTMLNAAILAFALAFCFGLPLMLQAGLWSIGIAGLCILFGMLYTGGPKPLGYAGLGEALVFIFFGPVACMGTYFLQTGTVTLPCFIASLGPGCISSAILMVNNLRDIATDEKAGKRTLAVRFGETFGKLFYHAMIMGAFLVFGYFKLHLASLIFLLLPIKKISFEKTCLFLFLYTAIFCVWGNYILTS